MSKLNTCMKTIKVRQVRPHLRKKSTFPTVRILSRITIVLTVTMVKRIKRRRRSPTIRDRTNDKSQTSAAVSQTPLTQRGWTMLTKRHQISMGKTSVISRV